jgi:hypothetical protein
MKKELPQKNLFFDPDITLHSLNIIFYDPDITFYHQQWKNQ